MERKRTIHILAITAVNGETFDLPKEQNAIIVCTGRENKFIYQCLPENILVIDFPDTEDEKYPGAFSGAHARKIISFVKGLDDKVTDIYVCCSKGSSRSTAVAAALLKMSGRSDRAVWCNPYYVPNPLVYLKLCREYGFFTTRLSVKIRSIINERAFVKAQKKGYTKYERWQIIY